MSTPTTHDPLVVNTQDGVVWQRRALTREGRGLYAVADAPACCPEYVMATLSELAEHGLASMLDALPMPVGPQQPPFPPAPRDFEEKLRQDVAHLQGLLADAVRDVHRANRERDLMRERVSEPFGCAHCGEVKRSHGRRYIGDVGMHAWERPSDEQVKARMLARRVARFTPYVERLASLLVARTEDLLVAEARIAELESERHSTNEALDDAVTALRASKDQPAPMVVPDADVDTLPAWLYARFTEDGEEWDSLYPEQREYWVHQARAVGRAVARGGFKSAAGDR